MAVFEQHDGKINATKAIDSARSPRDIGMTLRHPDDVVGGGHRTWGLPTMSQGIKRGGRQVFPPHL